MSVHQDGDPCAPTNGHAPPEIDFLSSPLKSEDDWHEAIPEIVPKSLDEPMEQDPADVSTNSSANGNVKADSLRRTTVITCEPASDDEDGAPLREIKQEEEDDEEFADCPESPASPPFVDDPDDDPDYTDNEEEVLDPEPLVTVSMEMIPPDADWEPVLELDRVEDTFDDEGNEIRAWSCKVCSIRFQFHASFAKHVEREHPDGLPLNWWELEPSVKELRKTYKLLDDSDDDWAPAGGKRKPGRPRKRRNRNRQPSYRSESVRAILPAPKRKRQTVVKPKDEPATCCECNREFSSKKKMEIHQKRYHFLPFQCKVCDKRFDSFKKYYVHSEMMHDKIVLNDEDKLVSLSDAGESDSEDHRLPEVEIKDSLFQCSHCQRHYVTEIALSGHLLRRHYDEIPDLAVIETHKRQWKTRFDPEYLTKHEAVLEQLGEKGTLDGKRRGEAIDWAATQDPNRKRRRRDRVRGYGKIPRGVYASELIEDPNDRRMGPVVLKRSAKTKEELAEAMLQRNLRRKKRRMEMKGLKADFVTINHRRAYKTVAEKLATHEAKLERRRKRDREKRAAAKKSKQQNKQKGSENPADAETEVELSEPESVWELDPKTGEQRNKKTGKMRRDPHGQALLAYPHKYGGVKDHCRKCGMEFENDRLTVIHLKDVHSQYTEEDKQREDELLRSMLTPEEYEELSLTKPIPKPGELGSRYSKDFICDICTPKKAYIAAYKLAIHYEDVHLKKLVIDGKEISRQCPEEHKRTEDINMICHRCGKQIRKKSLRMHMLRIHAGEPFRKSYPCDQCEKSYPVAHHLFWHRRKSHIRTVLYTCEVCNKSIHSPRTYKIHMRVHAGFMYECKHCGEKFKSQQGVANHEKRHTDTMKYECKFCAKRFWWQRDVNKHERIAHEDGLLQPDQIAINKAKDWEAESLVNAKKMRYLSDNPRAPNGSGGGRGRGRPRKNTVAESEDSLSQEYVPPSGHMTRAAAATAAQVAKDAIVATKPKRRGRGASKQKEQEEQTRAIESLDLEGLVDEQVEYSVVQDHMGNACQQILTIPSTSQVHQMSGHHFQHTNNHVTHGNTSYAVLHGMQPSHAMSSHHQMFLNSCMQQQQLQYQVPLIPGDCKLCRVRTNDLRAHYSEVHKVLADVVQHFL